MNFILESSRRCLLLVFVKKGIQLCRFIICLHLIECIAVRKIRIALRMIGTHQSRHRIIKIPQNPSPRLAISHLVEGLSVVHSNDGSDHFGNDNHVTQMRLDDCRLLIWRSLLLGLAQLLDQSERLALQSTTETPAGAAVHQLNQLVTKRRTGEKLASRVSIQTFISRLGSVGGRDPKQYSLGHVQKLVQVRSAVGELAEGALPLHMIFQL